MNEKRAILILLSRILDYPDTTIFEEQTTITGFVRASITSEDIQKEVLSRFHPFYQMSSAQLEELYVETFDYKEKTNLYLTAHELGDSRKRGFALIQLQKIISDSGFEYVGKDLADYIPMLLELLAVVPEGEKSNQLSRRISYAIDRIITNLPDDNPYKKALELGRMYAFETLSEEEISALERLREDADLDELPYPLMYG